MRSADDVDSWAVYGIDVNGFLTTYWNAEALSDSDQTHLVNEAYVIWANDTQTAWSDYSNEVADARGQQTLDDEQSANDAWHDINLATLIWYSDNAIAGNDYLDAVIPLESDYYSSMESAWVDYSVATNNAHATKTISIADARAATVRRWADGMAGSYPGIYAEFLADMEEATAARTETQELAEAGFSNAMVAAGAVWVETVLPAWVTYEDEVSDHTVSWVDTSSLAWETTENYIADAGLDYTTAAVPVGTQLTVDLNENYSDWVSDVATADELYWNELADHAVTWVDSATAAEEGYTNDTIVNWTGYVHMETSLDVQFTSAVSQAIVTWAGTLAGQLTGTPYTPPATQYLQFAQAGAGGTGVTAFQQSGQPQQQGSSPQPQTPEEAQAAAKAAEELEAAKKLLDSTSSKVVTRIRNAKRGGGINTPQPVAGSTTSGNGPCFHYARGMAERLKPLMDKLPAGTQADALLFKADPSKFPELANGKQPDVSEHIIVRVRIPGAAPLYYDAGGHAVRNGNFGDSDTGRIDPSVLEERIRNGAMTPLPSSATLP